jgi:hypothetical protein
VHPWEALSGGEVHDARAMVQEQPICQHEERARPLPDDCRKCVLDLFFSPDPQAQHFHSQHVGRGLRLLLGDHL